MKKKCIVVESTNYGENYLVLVRGRPYFVGGNAKASKVSFSYAFRFIKKEAKYCIKKGIKNTYSIIIT